MSHSLSEAKTVQLVRYTVSYISLFSLEKYQLSDGGHRMQARSSPPLFRLGGPGGSIGVLSHRRPGSLPSEERQATFLTDAL